MVNCKACNANVDTNMTYCPNCGSSLKVQQYNKTWFHAINYKEQVPLIKQYYELSDILDEMQYIENDRNEQLIHFKAISREYTEQENELSVIKKNIEDLENELKSLQRRSLKAILATINGTKNKKIEELEENLSFEKNIMDSQSIHVKRLINEVMNIEKDLHKLNNFVNQKVKYKQQSQQLLLQIDIDNDFDNELQDKIEYLEKHDLLPVDDQIIRLGLVQSYLKDAAYFIDQCLMFLQENRQLYSNGISSSIVKTAENLNKFYTVSNAFGNNLINADHAIQRAFFHGPEFQPMIEFQSRIERLLQDSNLSISRLLRRSVNMVFGSLNFMKNDLGALLKEIHNLIYNFENDRDLISHEIQEHKKELTKLRQMILEKSVDAPKLKSIK